MSKLTKEEIAYYKRGCDGLKFTAQDAEKVDSDRMESISAAARTDVMSKQQKRTAKDFKNAEEYKYYQLAVYGVAVMAEAGVS